MAKRKLKHIVLTLTLFSVFLLGLCFNAYGADSATEQITLQNPIYIGVEPALPETAGSETRLFAANATESPAVIATESELVDFFHSLLAQRQNEAVVHMTTKEFDLNQILKIFEQAVESADDYDQYNYHGATLSSGVYISDGFIFSISINYLTTAAQEEQVNEKVHQLLPSLITNGMSDDHKEKIIHDWIVTNVTYDETLTEYSAYAGFFKGTTVCQGYSLMTYKLLKEAGIECRIVSNPGVHAWNLVKIGNNYYHLDTTWDDPVFSSPRPDFVRYNYFNLSDAEIASGSSLHLWDKSKYPPAVEAYDLDNLNRIITDYDSLTWESIGTESAASVTQSLDLPEQLDNESMVSWHSTNPAVSGEGVITRPYRGQGNATGMLVATLTRGEVVEQKYFPVTVLESDILPPDAYFDWEEKTATALDKTWTVTLNQAIDSASIEGNIYVATDPTGTAKVTGATAESLNATVTISPPASGWATKQTYYLFVDRGLRSHNGNMLTKPVRMRFDTI